VGGVGCSPGLSGKSAGIVQLYSVHRPGQSTMLLSPIAGAAKSRKNDVPSEKYNIGRKVVILYMEIGFWGCCTNPTLFLDLDSARPLNTYQCNTHTIARSRMLSDSPECPNAPSRATCRPLQDSSLRETWPNFLHNHSDGVQEFPGILQLSQGQER